MEPKEVSCSSWFDLGSKSSLAERARALGLGDVALDILEGRKYSNFNEANNQFIKTNLENDKNGNNWFFGFTQKARSKI